jgi:hypothetical protein
MARGHGEAKTADDLEVRSLFAREALMASDWYRERLRTKQSRDVALWTRHLGDLEEFEKTGSPAPGVSLPDRLAEVRKQLKRVSAPEYLRELEGTLGADPFHGQMG